MELLKSVCFLIAVARSSVDLTLWSWYVMIGFVSYFLMTTNLSQLKIVQVRSKNKLTLVQNAETMSLLLLRMGLSTDYGHPMKA